MNRDLHRAAVAHQAPPRLAPRRRKVETLVFDQVDRLLRLAMSLQVPRRGKHQHLDCADPAHDQLLALHGADADGHIDMLTHKIALAGRQIELEGDAWKAACELRQQRADMVDAHIDRHRHAYMSRRACGRFAQSFLRQTSLVYQITAALEVASSGIGQLDPACGAVEQPHAELALHGGHSP
jgi:hypothetical protein